MPKVIKKKEYQLINIIKLNKKLEKLKETHEIQVKQLQERCLEKNKEIKKLSDKYDKLRKKYLKKVIESNNFIDTYN